MEKVEWLLGLIGEKIISVLALVYEYEGKKDLVNPVELELKFSYLNSVRFMCASDGASIDFQKGELEEIDMSEDGALVVVDWSESHLWCGLINKELIGLDLLYSCVQKSVIGIRFSFEGALFISLINLGDELYFYDSVPENILDDQNIAFFCLKKDGVQ